MPMFHLQSPSLNPLLRLVYARLWQGAVPEHKPPHGMAWLNRHTVLSVLFSEITCSQPREHKVTFHLYLLSFDKNLVYFGPSGPNPFPWLKDSIICLPGAAVFFPPGLKDSTDLHDEAMQWFKLASPRTPVARFQPCLTEPLSQSQQTAEFLSCSGVSSLISTWFQFLSLFAAPLNTCSLRGYVMEQGCLALRSTTP